MNKFIFILTVLLIGCGSNPITSDSVDAGQDVENIDSNCQLNQVCALEPDSTLATPGICKEFQGNFVCSSCGNDVEINEVTYQDQSYCTKCQPTQDGKYAHWEKLSIMECQ